MTAMMPCGAEPTWLSGALWATIVALLAIGAAVVWRAARTEQLRRDYVMRL
ncbi:hypothetical protein ABZ863_31105 [Saccharomonospora sp. NPDC046836]|uniref:hypothetical protein n=1 Tax=Saccharomonospora sp. NPDC046836 TaxID=3156921 RepID=UPI0033E2BAA9